MKQSFTAMRGARVKVWHFIRSESVARPGCATQLAVPGDKCDGCASSGVPGCSQCGTAGLSSSNCISLAAVSWNEGEGVRLKCSIPLGETSELKTG